jgi:DNA-binding winged helix-turn-helix (wHTH) protein
MSDPQRFFEFDNFLLDAQQRLLFRDGQPVELTPKVFDVLFELVQSGGRVIEKKELMEKVWPNSFVEEANLTQHVSTLRKKLGHDARQRYILTVPGRGYRFAAAIKGWDDDAIVTVEERVRSRITVGQPETPGETGEIIPAMHRVLPAVAEKRSRRWILIATGIGIILIGVVALSLVNALRRRPAPFTSIRLSKFTTDGRVSSAAISPNGKQVAYAEEADDGQQTLWLDKWPPPTPVSWWLAPRG